MSILPQKSAPIDGTVRPQLTSRDVMTILLVFLIKSFPEGSP